MTPVVQNYVVVVDPNIERSTLWAIAIDLYLNHDPEYQVRRFSSIQEAEQVIHKQPFLLIVAPTIFDMLGGKLFRLREQHIPIIILGDDNEQKAFAKDWNFPCFVTKLKIPQLMTLIYRTVPMLALIAATPGLNDAKRSHRLAVIPKNLHNAPTVRMPVRNTEPIPLKQPMALPFGRSVEHFWEEC